MGKDVPGYFIDTDKEAQMAKKYIYKMFNIICDLDYNSELQ